MKNYLIASVLLAVFTMPCAAQFRDSAAAKAALSGKTARERLDAIEYLGAQRSQDAYAALAGHFPSEKDAYLRVQIVEALDVAGSTWAYFCAEKAADDANRAVRQAAAAAIALKAGDPAADKKLKALAADASEPVRFAVVHALSLRPGPSSAAIIGGVLADQKAALRMRRVAAWALSNMKTPEADAELMKHISDADPEIQAAAVSRKPAAKEPAAKEPAEAGGAKP